ncbi:MAG: hypothetical protein PHY02_04940 [Phycisphaerae bacterium]|nr:hypothetical protein [Phycisphaerae bacterium]
MNGQNENLKELFEKFVEGEQAEQAAEDIRKGEQILGGNPAPQPDDELIANIKAEIAVSLYNKKQDTLRRTAYKMMAVAAGFMLLAVISVKLFEKNSIEPERAVNSPAALSAVWDNSADETLTAEIEQIESDLFAMQSSENSSNGSEAVTELEMEMIETNNDFWKG